MNYIFLTIILGILAISLSACYTVRGVGADVEATGEAVQRAATPGYY